MQQQGAEDSEDEDNGKLTIDEPNKNEGAQGSNQDKPEEEEKLSQELEKATLTKGQADDAQDEEEDDEDGEEDDEDEDDEEDDDEKNEDEPEEGEIISSQKPAAKK